MNEHSLADEVSFQGLTLKDDPRMAEKGVRRLYRRTQEEKRGIPQTQEDKDMTMRVQTNVSWSLQNMDETLPQLNIEMLERINASEKRRDERPHQTVYIPKYLVHQLTVHALATHEDIHHIVTRLVEQYLIAKETE